MNSYTFLGAAILFEIVGTMSLKFSEGFTRPLPILGVVVGYGLASYLVSLTLNDLPMGLVYGTWGALGIIGVAVIGILVFGEEVDLSGILGISLIVIGVYVVNVLSDMSVQ